MSSLIAKFTVVIQHENKYCPFGFQHFTIFPESAHSIATLTSVRWYYLGQQSGILCESPDNAKFLLALIQSQQNVTPVLQPAHKASEKQSLSKPALRRTSWQATHPPETSPRLPLLLWAGGLKDTGCLKDHRPYKRTHAPGSPAPERKAWDRDH